MFAVPNPNILKRPPKWFFWRRLALGVLLAGLLAVGGFGARPAYRKFKGWRSERLVAKSARLVAANNLSQAQSKARAALLLTPGEPRALRAMAVALGNATNILALQFWVQLLQTGLATDGDRHACAAQAIRAGDAGLAAQVIERLLSEAPAQGTNFWLASQLFVLLDDRSQTVHYATQAAVRDPANRQYNLFLSSLQFDAPDAATQAAARSNLWARAEDPDPLGLQAQGFLTQRDDLTGEQQTQLIALLRKHPLRNTTQDLLALKLELATSPGRRDELLTQAVERYRSAMPAARIEFAVWLNQREEFERTLAVLPLAEARTRKDFFLPHIDAAAGLGRWAQLLELLDTKPLPLEPTYVEAFRARCQAQLKNDSRTVYHWRAAIRAGEGNPEQLVWLALYAERCGELDTAKKSLRALIACLQNPRPAFQELERLIEASGSTQELRDLVAEMAKRWPREAALQNDLAYLNLLLGKDPAAAQQVAEQLMREFPENLPYRTTFALALCRQQEFADALRAYQGREFDWSQALPSQRAVYASVLAKNGRTDEARQIASDLPRQRLRPEELELLKPWL